MDIKVNKLSTTAYELQFSVEEADLKIAKQHAVNKLSSTVKIQGFRSGKAPAHLVEKSIDQAQLQNEFINEALNHSLPKILEDKNIRPVIQPEVELIKFVPYTTVEFKATVKVVGPIKLPDYKKLNVKKEEVKVTEEDISQVISNLQKHLAKKNDVDRASKIGDQVWIDFEGKDLSGEPVKGASGKDYPLILGSDTFIPGFEKNLIGSKKEDEKTFTLKFPKDYGVSALRNREVIFTCKVNKVQEVVEPEINDDLAKQANPTLSNIKELKEDIKKQLEAEKNRQSEVAYENEIIKKLSDSTTVDLPDELIDEQVEYVKRDLMQNLVYRGQTYQEYVESLNTTEKEYRENELLPEAKRRIVAGMALAEIAEKEGIKVTPEELELRVQIMKGQYSSNPDMQKELLTDEGQRNISGKLLTEKVVAKLKTY